MARERLRDLLVHSRGTPLDAETRDFMESRFGEDFRRVRVHADARAARAARAAGARAFAVGRHLVCGEGQYAPRTRAGRRLLAHELTHVVQQRLGKAASARSAVGAAGDPLEREADLVADRVVAGGVLPPISADAAGLIRRVVRVDPASVQFTIATRPSVNLPQVHPPGDPDHAVFTSNPIRLEAQARLVGAAGESADGWTLGFLQAQWVETNWIYYRGAHDRDGSLLLQRARPPARDEQVCRDTTGNGNATDFFYDLNMTAVPFPPACPVRVFLTVANGNNFFDQPGDSCNLVEPNFSTGKDNFLREAQLEFLFCTVFTAQDDAGNFHHLGSRYWNTLWQARFQPSDFTNIAGHWAVTPIPGGNGANVSGFIPGNPTDRRFAGMLTADIGDDVCNDIFAEAERRVEVRGAHNRREAVRWANFDVRR